MGVCTEERPVMHWQQSARFLGPARERSPTLPGTQLAGVGGHCGTVGGGAGGFIGGSNNNNNHHHNNTSMTGPLSILSNNNHPSLHRVCSACPPESCEHSNNNNNKQQHQQQHHQHTTSSQQHFGSSPIFNDSSPSCRRYITKLIEHANSITNYPNCDESPNSTCYSSRNNCSYDTSVTSVDRSVFDESSISYSDISHRIVPGGVRAGGPRNGDCSELVVGNCSSSATPLKSEPCGPPSSPDSSSETTLTGPEDCAGCGRLIQDRFYLSAIEKRWHAGCLQCCICRQPLDRETSCFSRDGNIYCKGDYYRVFGTRRCSRCLASISSSELVMRARHLVFHVGCFSCTVCNAPLTKGDQFGIRESAIFCRLHYEIALETQVTPTTPMTNSCSYATQYGSSPNNPASPPDPAKMVNSGYYVPPAHVISGLPQPPRQKGRPRKRKPKDIEALTANIDLNAEYLDFGRGHLGGSSRTKRMRTSFKHHQLRTMKSYFAINHNPDAKDLKQLSQKTGLPKRVLQVWFQNARAKWRRMMMKQDGKSGSDKSEGPLDLDSYSVHSPPFMLGGPPSPHSIE